MLDEGLFPCALHSDIKVYEHCDDIVVDNLGP